MTIQQAYKQLLHQLSGLYDEREAMNMCELVTENITGFKKINRILNKEFPLSDEQQKLWLQYSNELLLYKPVQYVLHEAWFAGMKLYVDENVLIPRPETEELVEWISKVNSYHHSAGNFSILDIGTGSGCIAIALKKKLKGCEVDATDISENALNIAKRNATDQQTDIYFYQLNILDKAEWKDAGMFDVIVSNPPYIKQSEEKNMHKNVLQFEPHIALFVRDEDALLFYKTIAEFGLNHLNKNGKIFFEINEFLGKEVCEMLENYGYREIELKKDLQQKDRMVKAAISY